MGADQRLRAEHFDREQRHEADHRTHTERDHQAVRLDEFVVIELVGLVPHADAGAAEVSHGTGDVQEVVEELGREFLKDRVADRQLQGDSHQRKGIRRDPGGAVRLIQHRPRRQRLAAIEDADVVEPEKTALEHIAAGHVFAVHPPGEVEHQLVKDALQEDAVAFAVGIAIGLVDRPCGPAVQRRVRVIERPFVAW